MIDTNLMNIKIESGEAEVLKVNERMSKTGVYIKTVKFNGSNYKVCTKCKFYQVLNNFTKGHAKCKTCRNLESNEKYYNDLEVQIRYRWHAINRSPNPKHRCTLEEFTNFFKTTKCLYTGRTLMEDFLKPSSNPNLRLEIDHIKPVANGGTSKIENLQVLPRAINTLKTNCSPNEFRETLDFLADVAGVFNKQKRSPKRTSSISGRT